MLMGLGLCTKFKMQTGLGKEIGRIGKALRALRSVAFKVGGVAILDNLLASC